MEENGQVHHLTVSIIGLLFESNLVDNIGNVNNTL